MNIEVALIFDRYLILKCNPEYPDHISRDAGNTISNSFSKTASSDFSVCNGPKKDSLQPWLAITLMKL